MNTQCKPSTTSELNVSEKSYISIKNQLEYMIKDQSYLWSLRDQKNIKPTNSVKNNIFLARFTEVKRNGLLLFVIWSWKVYAILRLIPNWAKVRHFLAIMISLILHCL